MTCLLIAAAVFPEQAEGVADACFRYRWVIAAVVFAACVSLRVNGESAAYFDEFLPTRSSGTESTVFGMARPIRTDDYGVATPAFFSQHYNGYGRYSDRIGISPTNMVLDYYAPVFDWPALGKPLTWLHAGWGSGWPCPLQQGRKRDLPLLGQGHSWVKGLLPELE